MSDDLKKKDEYFRQFLEGMEQISHASQKLIEVGKKIKDVNDVLMAEEKYDDLLIKSFGDGGSHIVIRGQSHLGKKTKVIIKSNKGGKPV